MEENKGRSITHDCGCVHRIGEDFIILEPCPRHKIVKEDMDRVLNSVGRGSGDVI
jgi:hypothetical protein